MGEMLKGRVLFKGGVRFPSPFLSWRICGANPKTSGKLAKLAASRRRRGASFSECSRHYKCSFFEVFGSFPMDKLTAIPISNNPRQYSENQLNSVDYLIL